MPEDSKELLCYLTDGFLFLSTSASNSFIRPFEITEQFAPLSIIAEGTCTIFSNGKPILQHILTTSLGIILRIKLISIGLGHEISVSDCDPSGAVWETSLGCVRVNESTIDRKIAKNAFRPMLSVGILSGLVSLLLFLSEEVLLDFC
ncbi:hypothetical protein F8M41_021111 [Gigaspora margarita]|uniref:Uncharacterized protein n=1 Tax=Gigaspora margarita TaxID=4874 RepID=A0A8H4EJ46_GIGMA|nr:hypothetical protein F8M41_021111 [Gigaspora margarita]